MEKNDFSVGNLSVNIEIVNLDEFIKLVNKASKEAEQLNETITQLNKMKLDIKVD